MQYDVLRDLFRHLMGWTLGNEYAKWVKFADLFSFTDMKQHFLDFGASVAKPTRYVLFELIMHEMDLADAIEFARTCHTALATYRYLVEDIVKRTKKFSYAGCDVICKDNIILHAQRDDSFRCSIGHEILCTKRGAMSVVFKSWYGDSHIFSYHYKNIRIHISSSDSADTLDEYTREHAGEIKKALASLRLGNIAKQF